MKTPDPDNRLPVRSPAAELVRRISPELEPEALSRDLEALRKKALDLGARESAAVGAKDIAFCLARRPTPGPETPPLVWPFRSGKDSLEEALRAYRAGVFFRVEALTGIQGVGHGRVRETRSEQACIKVHEIVSRLESECFYLGYHLALGFAAGDCQSLFCAQERGCKAAVKGKGCIRFNKGRPSMEAAGLDPRSLARRLKWRLPDRKAVPLFAGLVLVA